MFDLNERVSYLRGLSEGMGFKEDTNEGKLFNHIIDVLDDMAHAIAELETTQAEMEEFVETIDEDLADMEEALYEDELDDELGSTHYIEVECPHCSETVFFDEDIFDDDEDIVCPNCSDTIYSEDGYNKVEDNND